MTDIEQAAEDDLGIDRLRPGQHTAIDAALAGRDVLAVMPTGYGKSAIYQLAGSEIDGATLVVSPLIALQRDQIAGLDHTDVGEAVEINSSIGERARRDALERLRGGEVEFAFLAPEQLTRDDTMAALLDIGPSLVVVDEAHCISSWGHDFRPDYLRLGEAIDALGRPPVIALTATAAPPVQDEIVDRLGLRDPEVVVTGFDRPNIHLEVAHLAEQSAETKDATLLDRVEDLAGDGASAIVYVATRRRTEALAEALQDREIAAAAYHAGLPKRRRDEVHDGFLDGTVPVVVATTAFGMGVDKPDVRAVVHGDVPDSLDSYSQEIGRAGRDGHPAAAVLLYRPEDLGLRRFQGASGRVDPEDGLAVLEHIGAGGSAEVEAVVDALDMSGRRLTRVLTRLVDLGLVDRDGDTITARAGLDLEAAAAAIEDHDDARQQLEGTRLEMMRQYAETRACRRRVLLSYFGEERTGNCGRCDNCDDGRSDDADGEGTDAPFPVGTPVRHGEWGDGEVIRVDADAFVVLFDSGGYRTLSTELVLDNDLLERRAT